MLKTWGGKGTPAYDLLSKLQPVYQQVHDGRTVPWKAWIGLKQYHKENLIKWVTFMGFLVVCQQFPSNSEPTNQGTELRISQDTGGWQVLGVWTVCRSFQCYLGTSSKTSLSVGPSGVTGWASHKPSSTSCPKMHPMEARDGLGTTNVCLWRRMTGEKS